MRDRIRNQEIRKRNRLTDIAQITTKLKEHFYRSPINQSISNIIYKLVIRLDYDMCFEIRRLTKVQEIGQRN